MTPGGQDQYRARAVPLNNNEYDQGRREYLLRIDLERASSECRGETRTPPEQVGSPSFTLNLEDICPTCDSVTSSGIILYTVSSRSNTIFPTTLVEDLVSAFSRLEFKVQMNTVESLSGQECSESGCRARGYDCCLEGQCVRDGEERPEAISRAQRDPTGFGVYYNETRAHVAQTPSLFRSHGDIYFVCPLSSGEILSSILEANISGEEEAKREARERFEREKQEYLCLEGAKKEDYSGCLDENGDGASNEKDWEFVKKRVSQRYGCVLTTPTVPYCPDYGLRAQIDRDGIITAVLPDIPPPPQIQRPFQNLAVEISAKSVPHRFFRGDNGEAVDDFSLLEEDISSLQAEGTPFYYLYEKEQKGAVSGSFNMNAILGQMTVSLSGASPAKAVSVHFDRDYIIMATEGLHNPCPLCRRDPWFEPFTAYPSSSRGMGLQAVGLTTRRDVFANNRSRGNYEDTLFGRACWVPPTMIPFTHRPLEEGISEQRRRRLKAQAALFVNGYQRDWYGLNKGALIGSFDGVEWFAIGVGRKVRSTSDTLYLAINAPFGDLTEPSSISVSVVADLHPNQAPSVDYDHKIPPTDSRQNQAATCRHYHLCGNDIDCVTQLGWEYVCADISYYRSSWPAFDARASEISGREIAKADFSDILFGNNFLLSKGTKRCVYRGSGAICSRSPSDLSSDEERKLFSCAPNFYCEELGASSFNDRVARHPVEDVPTILYGREVDILGRPLHYVGASQELTSEIIDNLSYNASSSVYDNRNFEDNLGLCLPGKDVHPASTSWVAQQTTRDALGRTDYISQIASCDSSSYNTVSRSRAQSCPTFILDIEDKNFGNYTHINVPNPFSGGGHYGIKRYEMQNMCGGEALLGETNIFSAIESSPLGDILVIDRPTLARDACFKRAGTPCFTDLDCAPNRLHAQEAAHLNEDVFGGSRAEYEYWNEYLVCSQERLNHQERHNRNRCCREIGKDFTMYTRIDNTTSDLMDYLGLEDDPLLQNPQVETAPGEGGTRAGYANSTSGEYSRYTIVDMLTSGETAYAGDSSSPRSPLIDLSDSANPAAYQWRTFRQAGERTCCGGTWIRKFADGTSNWLKFKRLYLNYEKFRCLNHISPLSYAKPQYVAQTNWAQEADDLCLSPTGYGCLQQSFYLADTFEVQSPRFLEQTTLNAWQDILDGSDDTYGEIFTDTLMSFGACGGGSGPLCAYLDTTPTDGDCSGDGVYRRQLLNPFAPYRPLVLEAQQVGGQGDPFMRSCVIQTLGSDSEPVQYTLSLPVYMGGYENIRGIQFKFFDDGGSPLNAGDGDIACEDPLDDCGTVILKGATNDLSGDVASCSNGAASDSYPFAAHFASLGNGTPYDTGDGGNDDSSKHGAFCIHTDNRGRQILKVAFNKYASFDSELWQSASVRIEFNAIGTSYWQGPVAEKQSLLPGNDTYYLTKLGRLELLGIPQMFYGPLYCNHNYDKLLPDLYTEDLYDSSGDDDRAVVEANGEVFRYSTSRYGTGRGLENIYDKDFNQVDDSKTGDGYIMYANKINHEAIFSAHGFKCCRALGQVAHSPQECCSGFATLEEATGSNGDSESQGNFLCKLPNGTNLNVYFNRFVSNEGQGDNGGLTDDDFIPETGELKLQTSSYQKLRNLGATYCDSGSTTRGGLFGLFPATLSVLGGEPEEGGHPAEHLRYSITDESTDDDSGDTGRGGGNKSGAAYFESGLHWDHHIYCSPGEGGG